MPVDPNDPALDIDLEAFLEFFAGLPSYENLGQAKREEIRSFARLALVTDEDGNVQLATTLLSAMARLREDPDDTVGWVLLNLACELARRALIAVR
jgi:hypothetical protein